MFPSASIVCWWRRWASHSSTKLGNFVVLGGQVGIAGHLKIGDRATIGPQAGVMRNVKEGDKVFGSPAIPDLQAKRQFLALQRLPRLAQRVRELEKKLGLKPTVEDLASEDAASE